MPSDLAKTMDGQSLHPGLVTGHGALPSLSDGCAVLQGHIHFVVHKCRVHSPTTGFKQKQCTLPAKHFGRF